MQKKAEPVHGVGVGVLQLAALALNESRALDGQPYLYHSRDMEKSNAITALAALAQESRLDIFRLLVQAGAEGLPVGRIGDRLGGMPSATLSFHLNQLRQAGLVTFRREGRSLIYAAEYAAMNELMAYLTENCCRCRRLRRRRVRRRDTQSKGRENPPMKRLHVHVSVSDLAQSIWFYSTLFAADPTVTNPDYAKWMLEDPRVNFAISTRGKAGGLATGCGFSGRSLSAARLWNR